MKKGMHVFLRPGERLYVNGAVLKVDRKVSLEFLNDVTFLLESHVLQADDAKTPLRQLYFVLQTMLIDPSSVSRTRKMFESSHARIVASLSNEGILSGLGTVHALVAANRVFEALKTLRVLFPIEDAVLSNSAMTLAAGQNREEAACKPQA